jgi:hypothetical protein
MCAARPTSARALALTGRGLLDFLAGAREHCDDDLEAALEIFRRHDDVESTALAYSFYAELPNARGDLDEARRRRLVLVDYLRPSRPDDPSPSPRARTGSGSWRSWTGTSPRPRCTTAPRRKASPASIDR